jgi:hypothetical protein
MASPSKGEASGEKFFHETRKGEASGEKLFLESLSVIARMLRPYPP